MSELTLEIVLRSIFGPTSTGCRAQAGGNPFDVVTKEHGAESAVRLQVPPARQGDRGARCSGARENGEEHPDFLGMLMTARDKETGDAMSERELIDEVMTLVVAGHETTASGLNWTWYLLSQHPGGRSEAACGAGRGARREGRRASRRWKRSRTRIRWSTRRCAFIRRAGCCRGAPSEPDTLAGYEIPAGTSVMLSPYLLHRHPRYWKEPDAFRPERFAPEHEAERPRFAYMPFAAGPRHCIGETLALYEMLMHLYKVARRYRLTYVADRPIELEAQINLRTRQSPVHETGTPLMTRRQHPHRTDRRQPQRRRAASPISKARTKSAAVSFGELHERALGILYHLQKLGAKRGDKLILFLGNNEQFIDAFWAAVLGGIVPVPVALGISDEHRHKLLRIARKLGKPFIYTERRSLDRIGAFAAQAGEADVFAGLQLARVPRGRRWMTSRAPASRIRAQPGDIAFIQFSSGSTSEPKGVVLTHANILANSRGATEAAKFTPDDVSLSWMPLTHDMGLIGFHIFMFANRIHCHLMPTELFIRRPLLWLTFATRKRATILCSPNFGYKHYLKVLGDRADRGAGSLGRAAHLQWGGADLGGARARNFSRASRRRSWRARRCSRCTGWRRPRSP